MVFSIASVSQTSRHLPLFVSIFSHLISASSSSSVPFSFPSSTSSPSAAVSSAAVSSAAVSSAAVSSAAVPSAAVAAVLELGAVVVSHLFVLLLLPLHV